LRWFYWVSKRAILPSVDLRAHGWQLRPSLPEAEPDGVTLLDHETADRGLWRALNRPAAAESRRQVMVLGVADSSERARLLRKGFGDAVPAGMGLAEVHARALRILENAQSLQRWRELGPLQLDLLGREAFVGGKPLGLHPREFGMLWRLMDTPDRPVDKVELLRDVWRLSHVPETNSVAVHTSRLRAKMAAVGLSGWIRTMPRGGYQLATEQAGREAPPQDPSEPEA